MRKFIFLWTAMLLTLLLCPAGLALSKDSLLVQDLYNYMDGALSFDTLKTNGEGMQLRSFKGSSDEKKNIDRYVKDLTSGSYNFKLVDSYFEDYGSDKFFSYALDYTGTGKVHNRSEMNFKDNVYGHLTIYGVIERSKMNGYIYIGKGLSFDDLGLRYTGKHVTVKEPGISDGIKLSKDQKGVYSVDNKRLQAKAGEAMIISGGKTYTSEATLTRNKTKNREEFLIENYNRNDSFLLTLPYNSAAAGDTFNKRSIGFQDDGGYDKYMKKMDDFLSWKFSDRILGVCHSGDYLLCYQDDHNDIEEVSIRILEWDTKNKVAVVYFFLKFKTEPYEVEALAAMNMDNESIGEDADGVYTLNLGRSAELDCGLSHFGASYNIYKWEIVSGHSLIELSNDISKTCKITAKKEGIARIKATYEYGAEGRDVLTNRKRTEHKSKTAEFVIVIPGKFDKLK